MRIILLRESGRGRGRARTVRIGGAQLAALSSLVGAMLVSLTFAAASWYPTESIGADMVSEWQRRLSDQTQELEQLRSRAAAEAQAVGRQLAAMQARLLRMEALGARVTEVADLDDGEFSFDQPAPVGGPTGTGSKPLAWTDLQQSLDELSAQLATRETELEVLESLLRSREYEQGTVVAGRPVTWGWMSSGFGRRVDPFNGQMAWHAGVDFAGREGSDVVAVASGVVTFAGKRYGYGQMVEINHGDGYVTRYGHHETLAVKVGDIVKKGQVIGTMGSSGRSTGPHVHFEVLKNGRHVDPKAYVARR
ncbi:MAG TPA: peptidoglycan DD-metalloendopeptidase family protein [Pseudomonadales bacterium]